MGLFLRAFKPAKNMTLKERTMQVIHQQRFISDELNLLTWYKEDKTELDLNNDGCYESIYKRAKKGMNAKQVTITRYNENDTPDAQSTCFFLKSRIFNPDPFTITHRLGYFGKYSEDESISIDHFDRAEEFNNLPTVRGLIYRIISEYKPRQLYLSEKKYFHEILKPSGDIPWTGWFTYLDNSISLPKNKPTFCQVEQLERGTLFCTSASIFDVENPEHVNTALKLSKWFADNKVQV